MAESNAQSDWESSAESFQTDNPLGLKHPLGMRFLQPKFLTPLGSKPLSVLQASTFFPHELPFDGNVEAPPVVVRPLHRQTVSEPIAVPESPAASIPTPVPVPPSSLEPSRSAPVKPALPIQSKSIANDFASAIAPNPALDLPMPETAIEESMPAPPVEPAFPAAVDSPFLDDARELAPPSEGSTFSNSIPLQPSIDPAFDQSIGATPPTEHAPPSPTADLPIAPDSIAPIETALSSVAPGIDAASPSPADSTSPAESGVASASPVQSAVTPPPIGVASASATAQPPFPEVSAASEAPATTPPPLQAAIEQPVSSTAVNQPIEGSLTSDSEASAPIQPAIAPPSVTPATPSLEFLPSLAQFNPRSPENRSTPPEFAPAEGSSLSASSPVPASAPTPIQTSNSEVAATLSETAAGTPVDVTQPATELPPQTVEAIQLPINLTVIETPATDSGTEASFIQPALELPISQTTITNQPELDLTDINDLGEAAIAPETQTIQRSAEIAPFAVEEVGSFVNEIAENNATASSSVTTEVSQSSPETDLQSAPEIEPAVTPGESIATASIVQPSIAPSISGIQTHLSSITEAIPAETAIAQPAISPPDIPPTSEPSIAQPATELTPVSETNLAASPIAQPAIEPPAIPSSSETGTNTVTAPNPSSSADLDQPSINSPDISLPQPQSITQSITQSPTQSASEHAGTDSLANDAIASVRPAIQPALESPVISSPADQPLTEAISNTSIEESSPETVVQTQLSTHDLATSPESFNQLENEPDATLFSSSSVTEPLSAISDSNTQLATDVASHSSSQDFAPVEATPIQASTHDVATPAEVAEQLISNSDAIDSAITPAIAATPVVQPAVAHGMERIMEPFRPDEPSTSQSTAVVESSSFATTQSPEITGSSSEHTTSDRFFSEAGSTVSPLQSAIEIPEEIYTAEEPLTSEVENDFSNRESITASAITQSAITQPAITQSATNSLTSDITAVNTVDDTVAPTVAPTVEQSSIASISSPVVQPAIAYPVVTTTSGNSSQVNPLENSPIHEQIPASTNPGLSPSSESDHGIDAEIASNPTHPLPLSDSSEQVTNSSELSNTIAVQPALESPAIEPLLDSSLADITASALAPAEGSPDESVAAEATATSPPEIQPAIEPTTATPLAIQRVPDPTLITQSASTIAADDSGTISPPPLPEVTQQIPEVTQQIPERETSSSSSFASTEITNHPSTGVSEAIPGNFIASAIASTATPIQQQGETTPVIAETPPIPTTETPEMGAVDAVQAKVPLPSNSSLPDAIAATSPTEIAEKSHAALVEHESIEASFTSPLISTASNSESPLQRFATPASSSPPAAASITVEPPSATSPASESPPVGDTDVTTAIDTDQPEQTVAQLLASGNLPHLSTLSVPLGQQQPLGNFQSLLPAEALEGDAYPFSHADRGGESAIVLQQKSAATSNGSIGTGHPVPASIDTVWGGHGSESGASSTPEPFESATDDIPDSWSSLEELLSYGSSPASESVETDTELPEFDDFPSDDFPSDMDAFADSFSESSSESSSVAQSAVAPPPVSQFTPAQAASEPVQFSFHAPAVQPVQFSIDYSDSSGTDAPIQAKSAAMFSESKHAGSIPGLANYTENLMASQVRETFGDVNELLDDRLPKTEKMMEELNLETLAREIYNLIRQRLEIERERRNELPYSGRLFR